MLEPVTSYGAVENGYLEDSDHLNYPYGIAAYGNTIWIAESKGERAVQFQNDGTYLGEIGKAGFRSSYWETELESVYDAAVDSSGNVYLADASSSHVAAFTAAGDFIRNFGQTWVSGSSNELLNNPYGVAVDSSGYVYVSDSGNCRIQVFQSDGTYLTTIGVTGVCDSANTHFSDSLRHMDIYGSHLYVADAGNSRVQIFDITAPATSIPYVATLGTNGVSGADDVHFNMPLGVAVDSSRIFVADSMNQRVQVFDRSSRVYQSTLSGASAEDVFTYPSDVDTDASGNVYVSDWDSMRVIQFDSSLSYLREYGEKGVPYLTDLNHYNRPTAIAYSQFGYLYLTEGYGHRLIILDDEGNPISAVGEAGIAGYDNDHFAEPQGVAVDSDGNVYVADSGNNRIQIFSATGAYISTKGETGSGEGQFIYPTAVAFGLDGQIYVADVNNGRVQVFDKDFNYQDSITGLNYPIDLTVDSAGNLYVLDQTNQSVEIYDQNLVHQRTIGGGAGSTWDNFMALDNTRSIAVDEAGRIYVTPTWGNRLIVFDADGSFLSAYLGNGSQLGQVRQIQGMTFDAQGRLCLVDEVNHRVQVFKQGISGWEPVSVNGFGDARIWQMPSMVVHNGELFAGAWYMNWDSSGHSDLYYTSTGNQWTAVGLDFGNGAATLISFENNLYLGTWDGRLYRSADGKTGWSQINIGWTDYGFATLASFNNTIYATTWDDVHGTQIWRSDSGDAGDWEMVVSDGFGSVNRIGAISRAVFNNQLYFGLVNPNGADTFIARTSNGSQWEKVGGTAFTSANLKQVTALAVFKDKLYAFISGDEDAQVWSSNDGSTWQSSTVFALPKVFPNAKGSLEVYWDSLYLIAENEEFGLEIWMTRDGSSWRQVADNGFNGAEHIGPYWDSATVVFKNELYFGDRNTVNGSLVWKMTLNKVFQPFITN